MALTVLGCEGDVGPMGPAGPEGPEGPPGPAAEILVGTAFVNSEGSAIVNFSGVSVEEAVVSCWLSSTGDGWLHVGTDLDGPTCGAGNTSTGLTVVVINASPGWIFMATVAAGA